MRRSISLLVFVLLCGVRNDNAHAGTVNDSIAVSVTVLGTHAKDGKSAELIPPAVPKSPQAPAVPEVWSDDDISALKKNAGY